MVRVQFRSFICGSGTGVDLLDYLFVFNYLVPIHFLIPMRSCQRNELALNTLPKGFLFRFFEKHNLIVRNQLKIERKRAILPAMAMVTHTH